MATVSIFNIFYIIKYMAPLFVYEKDFIQGSREKPDWTKFPREEQDPDGGPRESGLNSRRAYFEKIFIYDEFVAKFPNTVKPNLKLTDANEKLKFKKYSMIELDSLRNNGVQGGTINNVMVVCC